MNEGTRPPKSILSKSLRLRTDMVFTTRVQVIFLLFTKDSGRLLDLINGFR